jgi:hypothetical protein
VTVLIVDANAFGQIHSAQAAGAERTLLAVATVVGTPLERDKSLGTRAFLTEDEFAKRQARAQSQAAIDNEETVSELTRCDPGRGGLGNTASTCLNGVSIGPPLYWDDRGKPSKQASLVMDPPDGRIPCGQRDGGALSC